MKLSTPDGIYTLSLAPAPLKDDEGNPLDGQADYSRKKLEISPDSPMRDRPLTSYHEYAHVWVEWAGVPKTVEQFCDLYARMTNSLMADVMKQGGPDALMLIDLTPQDRFDAATLTTTLAAVKGESLVECCRCQQRIAGGSVIVSAPRLDPAVSSLVVTLAFYCESCDHVQKWRELASTTGKPTGAWAGEAEYLRGAEKNAFLQLHGTKYGHVLVE